MQFCCSFPEYWNLLLAISIIQIVRGGDLNSIFVCKPFVYFLLSSFLQKFSLCQDRWHGEVHPHLVQPSYVALGRALLCVKSNTSFTLDYCSHQLYAQSKRRTSNSNVPGHPVPFVYYSGPNLVWRCSAVFLYFLFSLKLLHQCNLFVILLFLSEALCL